MATQRSLRHTGAEISQEEFDDTRTRLGLGRRRCPCGRRRRPVSILRGELIGSIDSPLACPGTTLEHTAFFSVRTSIVIVIASTGGYRRTTNDGRTTNLVSGRLLLRESTALSLYVIGVLLPLLSFFLPPTKCGLGVERPLAASSLQHLHQISTFSAVEFFCRVDLVFCF